MRACVTTLATCLLYVAHGSAVCADGQTEPDASPIPLETSVQPTPEESGKSAVGADSVASNQALDRPEGVPVYVPPHRGAPKTRVGGGTRSLSIGADAAEVLTVLSPPQMGLTQQAQPTLYWFLSASDAGPFEFVLTTNDSVAPLWRGRVDGPLRAGIHALSLHEQNVVLEDGVEYQWSVAIVRDPERRSRDVVAIGTLQRVAAEPTPTGTNAVFELAARGLWYDALQQLEELIGQSTDDATLQDYRVALLDQADLGPVAQYVRNSPTP